MGKSKKLTALLLLLIHGLSVFYPGVSYALTNGPTAPESSQFQPASVTNLVDPFSGDFNYNIPLLDVDGYPINIAYSSGGGMDDESSWVGYGWNINPGSVSRNMKGIPDDFDGTDKIKKEYNIRPDVTGGISFNASTEIFGLDFLGANASADIFYNNQRGLGVEIGAGISATLSTAKHAAGEYTAGLTAGASLGITSNSQTGADFNFGANMGISVKDKENATGSMGLRFGGSLNSRAGLKSTTLSGSFNTSKKESDDHKELREAINEVFDENFAAPSEKTSSNSLGSTTTSYGMAFTPTITMPMKNLSFSLSPQVGPEFWGFQIPLQLTAHYSQQKLATSQKEFPAYGFLHSAQGRTDVNALLDFNREKDAPYQENTPTLSVPYVTQDIFTATSHLGSSQFKAVSNSTGVFFDSYATNTSDAFSLGIEFGLGGGIKGGADLSGSGSSTVTRKWTGNNDYLQNGDFSNTTAVDGEDTYFKLVGEKSSINKEYLNKIADKTPVKVQTANVDDEAKAFSTLAANTANYPVSSKIARNKREPKGEVFMPLTADQAQNFALDKTINNYTPIAGSGGVTCNNGVFGNFIPINRVNGTHKGHHISEIKLTKNDGMRLVYGVPVYNNEQVDVTMSVGGSPSANNMVNYSSTENSTGNSSGVDHYFSKETIPPYATSFLLSGVCSPDYVDVTGNGISDDDLGAAVKFNYSLINPAYRWRTPNAASGNNYANFSEGNKSQSDDNKASISYGNKELWYTHSIESKNMVAVFRLGDRNDGYGYNADGTIDNASRQKKLDRIDLYTKAELLTNPGNPTPIKSVHFEYDYSLFGNVPNNTSGGGKLTLKSIYFTYGNSGSGEENRYKFTYNASGNFQYQQYDRWGTYKDKSWNNSIAGVDLDNNDFPYSVQDKAKADEAVKKWQLSEIELPSGGKIKVDYESDDYAYVQNQRAMQMAKIVGYGNYYGDGDARNFTDYQLTDKVYIKLPAATTNANIKWQYFDGVDQLYFKSMINLDNNGSDELVSGFAKIKAVNLKSGYNDIAEVTLEKRGDYHPIAAAGWQFMRSNLPKLAYPYSVNDGLSPLAFVKALIAAIRNVGELLTPFEQKAMRMKFASHIIPGKGFARITNNYMKYGGGSRVKRIIMDDIWSDMVGSSNGTTTTTGMEFDYTKKYVAPDGNKITISSGVASYEPAAGGEENPFRQPISYQQRAHLTSSIYTVEEPLGESYFPAASVGYSQVTVKNLDATGHVVNNGYTVKRFYTAKDFPTIVKRTDLSKNKYNQSSIFGLFNIDQGNSVVLSQGFYVETNDMHGKALSDETFDGSGKMLSGSYYHYKSSGSEQMTVDNNALTLQPDGTIKDDIVGQEFEMYTDMREQVTDNIGVNENINLDVLFFTFITIPIPTFIPIVQSSHCGYEAASTIKVVNRYAIPDKVTTIENGSTMTSENVLWDALTGQVLLTKTQNGFDDPLYNFTLPAYMVNEYERGMGAAYKNTGIVFNSVSVSNGVPSGISSYLVPGDELGISGTNNTVWAMDISQNIDRGHTPDIRLINKDGSMYTGTAKLILLRSGRRNMMGASTYSVVSLKNPIRNGKIDIDVNSEILSTSAGTFSDEWAADTKNTSCINWAQGGKMSPMVNGKYANNLKAPIAVKDLIAKQKTKQPAHNNLKAPVAVKDLIAKQKNKAAALNNLKAPIKIKDLIAKRKAPVRNNLRSPISVDKLMKMQKANKGKKQNALTQGIGCDVCSDLTNFTIDRSFIGGDADPCVSVTSNCASFPLGKRVVFDFSSNCTSGAGTTTNTAEIIIDRNHLTGQACFGNRGLICDSIILTGWHCEDIPLTCDACATDLSAYRFTTTTTPDGAITCTDVAYGCDSASFPLNKRVVFNFSGSCNGVPQTGTVTLTRDSLTGSFCIGKWSMPCLDPDITLESWYCEDLPACNPCSDLSNYVFSGGYPNVDGFKIKYFCSQPFPANTVAIFNFHRICSGTIENISIHIDKDHLVGDSGGATGIGCGEWILDEWHCEQSPQNCDPCSGLDNFTITEDLSVPDDDCITVAYKCDRSSFPANKRVVFTFSRVCGSGGGPVETSGVQAQTIIIDRDHLSGTICFGTLACHTPVSLTDWHCEDVYGCDPCSPSSYTITKTNGSPVDGCGKVHVNVSYNCPELFPPNVSAILSFSFICNGVACQTKTVQITSTNTSGIACFLGNQDPVSCPCPSNPESVQLNSITGTACNPVANCCPVPIDQHINPYYTGLKGNWRGKQSYVYAVDRDPKVDPINTAKLPTNTRKGGIFKYFTSFYKVVGGKFVSIVNNTNTVGDDYDNNYQPSDGKWIASATVKKVNSKGQEVENKDALGKYSTAQFGFNDLITTAVASNARNNEMGYDGFEDYGYSNSCGSTANADNCNEDGHFNFKKALRLANGLNFTVTGSEAHTGNYSVLVQGGNSGAAYTRRALKYNLNDAPKYRFNGNNEMILKDGGTIESFKPLMGKKYVISGWIKGDVAFSSDPNDNTKAKIVVEAWNESSFSAYYTAIATKAGPKVEGWTRVMATFEVPVQTTTSGDYIKIMLVPGSQNAYFDDIRIHPYDGNMKSFAYDYRTSRLMAELDENNYATFFEYNDEGQLMRNKKETEKGIVTLKETRSRVRKNNGEPLPFPGKAPIKN